MDWNCKISDERLSEYLDGKLPAADASAFAVAYCRLRGLRAVGRPRWQTRWPDP